MTAKTTGNGGAMRKSVIATVALLVLLLLTACEYTDTSMLPKAEAARLAVIMTATAEAQIAADQERTAAGYASATATAENYYMEVARINATATAEAIAREEKQRAIEATSTAVAFQPTATAIAQAAVARDIELERQRLALAEEQRRAARKARQDEMLLPFTTYGPWVIGVILAGVLIYGLIRLIITFELRGRAIKRDARGDAPLMVMRNGRATVIYDADRMFGPVTRMEAGGITMPALIDDAYQAQVTMRDQAVDLATRHLPQADTDRRGMNSRQRAAAKLAMTGGAPPIVRVIDAQAVRGWLQEVNPQALQLSMNEVNHE
jgi:hypothetical protein